MKWLKISIVFSLGLILTAALTLYAISSYKLNRTHAVPPLPQLTQSSDPEVLARGGHIATSLGMCTECHGGDLGGKIMVDAGPLGLLAGPNLTQGRGGIGGQMTDEDWVRAIRHGIRRDGSSLIVMPSETFVYMTKDDLSALVSYLKQLSPVDREMPETHLRLLGRTLLALGKLPILVADKTPDVPLRTSIRQTPSVEYGQYLSSIGGCRGCHGLNLSGGTVHGPPGTPPASNLTRAGIGNWSEAQFVRTLRTGKRPDDRELHESMPWRQTALMTDDELHAIWLYLRSVPPRAFGNN